MKKIIYIVIISIFITLSITLTTKASVKDFQFDEIEFVYNQNFFVNNYENRTDDIVINFALQDEIFYDNEYLQTSIDLQRNILFIFYSFEVNLNNTNAYFLTSPTINNNELTATIYLNKELFSYYIEEIAQVSELLFYTRFLQDYIEDVSYYFKLYVKTESQYQLGYDEGYNRGWEDGEYYGYFNGHDDGYTVGYDDGYSYGHDIGRNEGLNEGTSAWGVLFTSMLSTFGAVLSIEIFPNLTLGMIAAVPLILGLLSFIIGVAKGGKKND